MEKPVCAHSVPWVMLAGMAESRVLTELEAASPADLHALVPRAREAGQDLSDSEDPPSVVPERNDTARYVAELVAEAPPLSDEIRARLAALLDS